MRRGGPDGGGTTRPSDALIRATAWSGVVVGLYFFAALIVLNLLQPEIDPVRRYVSELARGRFGLAMVATFVVGGAGLAAVALGLRRSLAPTSARTWATGLLVLAGLGMAALGPFPVDPPGTRPTAVGLVHGGLAFVVFAAINLAFLGYASAFAADAQWRPYHRASVTLAATSSILFLGYFALGTLWWMTRSSAARSILGGVERAAVVASLAWLVATSYQLRARAGAAGQAARWASARVAPASGALGEVPVAARVPPGTPSTSAPAPTASPLPVRADEGPGEAG